MLKRIVCCLFLFCFLASNYIIAQEPIRHQPDTENSPITYSYVEFMPKARYDLNNYIAGHLVYPASATQAGVTGRVIVKFVVTETGSIEEPVIIKGVDSACDAAVITVLKDMPSWAPGKQNGVPVRVYITVPVALNMKSK